MKNKEDNFFGKETQFKAYDYLLFMLFLSYNH